MPSALAITRSSGVVMKPRTRSAFAPTYVVETCTTAMSLRGYWRTLSERIDCRPAIRITRLTTIANTGRLIKRSVNFIGSPRLAVLRPGGRIVFRLNFVVDRNGGTIAQLENAGADYFVAFVHARDDRNLVTARTVDLYELLPHAAVGLPLRTLQIGDDVNRVAIRCIADR